MKVYMIMRQELGVPPTPMVLLKTIQAAQDWIERAAEYEIMDWPSQHYEAKRILAKSGDYMMSIVGPEGIVKVAWEIEKWHVHDE